MWTDELREQKRKKLSLVLALASDERAACARTMRMQHDGGGHAAKRRRREEALAEERAVAAGEALPAGALEALEHDVAWARVEARPRTDVALNVHTVQGGPREAYHIFRNIFFGPCLSLLPLAQRLPGGTVQ